MFKKLLFVLLSLMTINFPALAENLKIAAGAGYKAPVMELIKEYEKNGKKVDAFFGNMKQVTTQAKHTDIALIIGDKKFLSTKSQLKFDEYLDLGVGKLVIAYPKGSNLTSVQDLQNENIKKIAIPQASKAIYGIAGMELLENTNIYDSIKDKLLVVATVPHSMTYVITNEVDAGIVNLTAALANEDKIGGYIEAPVEYYSDIEIVAGKLVHCNSNKCEDFVDFLSSPTSKNIFKNYGM